MICLAFAAPAPASATKILDRGNGAEPKGLDPHQAAGDPENNIIGDMLLGLYTEDAAGHPIFGAAESVTISADGLRWTFKIRDHKWSDGVPATAEDFVFAYRRILDPKTAAEYRNILYPIKNAERVSEGALPVDQLGVSAPDPRTLVIDLEHAAPYLPQMLTHYAAFPIPKHVVEKHPSDWTKAGVMVSNGAYVLAERRPYDHIKLVKNPSFYDAANVKIDEVNFFPTSDESAALKAYRAGELDVLDRWPLPEHKWLAANIPNETRKYIGLRVLWLAFNLRKPPLSDRRVRLALAMALDCGAIQREVYFNVHGVEALSVLPPGMANVDASAQVHWAGQSMPARLAEAKRLLAQAGFGPTHPLKLAYNFINTPDTKRGAIAMQAMWKQIGADVELVAKDRAIHYDLLATGNFDIGLAGWVYDYDDAKSALFLFQSSTDQMNYPGYKNPIYDALMRRSDNEKDATARGKLLGQAAGMLLDDVVVAPTFFQFIRPLVKPYVRNWENNRRGINRTRWLDTRDTPVAATGDSERKSAGGFWSWFSWDAWRKWWNS